MKHLEEIIEPISDRLIEYFNEDISIKLEKIKNSSNSSKNIELLSHTVLINISGNLNGGFILSSDDKFALALVEMFSEVELSKEEQKELAGEALSESLNIIVGNSYHLIPSANKNIEISPPFGLENTQIIKNYKKADTTSRAYKSQKGRLTLSFIDYRTKQGEIKNG